VTKCCANFAARGCSYGCTRSATNHDRGIRGVLLGAVGDFGTARQLAAPNLVWSRVFSNLMGRAGIEPATLGLKVPCSTN
jgi:hypothetical protein